MNSQIKIALEAHKKCKYLVITPSKGGFGTKTAETRENADNYIKKHKKYSLFFVKSRKEIIEIESDGVEIHDAMPIHIKTFKEYAKEER